MTEKPFWLYVGQRMLIQMSVLLSFDFYPEKGMVTDKG